METLIDSCLETLIPENDDFFLKCNTLSIGTQATKKSTSEKRAQYKDAAIRYKFTQTVNVITYNTIDKHTNNAHPCTCLESKKKVNQVLREQNKKLTLFVYGIGI